MTTVRQWTGHEARALRLALRLTVRGFAEHLGVAVRTVSKWEAGGGEMSPRPDTQAILDTALSQANAAAQERFALLAECDGGEARSAAEPTNAECESWVDDLDRAVIALSRQDFASIDRLVNHWLVRYPLPTLGDSGRYLRARSLSLIGAARRDQGSLMGPGSAEAAFVSARTLYTTLDLPRRVAQTDLALAVLVEMAGRPTAAISRYERFTTDKRLRKEDQLLAVVWAGRAHSKLGDPAARSRAIDLLSTAVAEFERLNESGFWAFALQKLALAYRATGDLTRAQQHIDTAIRCASTDSPLQHVRLPTAQAHVLSTDPCTRGEGLEILSEASAVAARSGLGHQLDSIRSLRTVLRQRDSGWSPPADPRRTELLAPSTDHRAAAT